MGDISGLSTRTERRFTGGEVAVAPCFVLLMRFDAGTFKEQVWS